MADNGAPAAIIKRSKVRTARTRAKSPSEDEPKVDAGLREASPSTLVAKLKKQHKERNKPKSRLSFGVDDEEGDGEIFQVKKSNLSRKLKLGANPDLALPENLDQASISPQSSGVVYSKEYLSELKANTLSAPPPPANAQKNEPEMLLDVSEAEGAVIVNHEMASENTDIPSESSILAAKQKRERMRHTKTTTTASTGEEDGFISLSVTRKEDTYQGPHPESRLMREDDDLGEGDDEFAEYTAAQERVALGKKAKKKEAQSRRSAMQDMIKDAEEEDEETAEWEREQLRRGGRLKAEKPNPPVKQEYRPAPIPPPTALPTLDVAISRLSQSLTQLTLSHASNTTSMNNLADERDSLEDKEKEMRTMVENAERKRSWFISFREWVETVATFLDEKYPLLEKLEDEHTSLLKERSDMIAMRRAQDDEDDLSLFLNPPPSDPGEPEELDELGRRIPRHNSEVTRKDRRLSRAARHAQHGSPHDEGFSTDSSLPSSDETDFQAALASLQSKSLDVLQDVRSDDFRDPRVGVARWFGEWREKYSDTYTGAFGGLGMVSAWEFWVRLEILGWDPLAEARTLDSFSWFSALYDYSRPRVADDDNDDEPELGPDGDLVSAMISTAVVPRLCKAIREGAFDPYSSNHLRNLIDLAEQVEASSTPEKFEMLLKTVTTTFGRSLEADAALIGPWLERGSTMKFDPKAIPARRRYLTRRRKLVSNMVRWRKYSGEKFSIGDMIIKMVNESILPVAKTGWDVGGGEVMQKVSQLLPPDLRTSNNLNGMC